MYYVMPIYSPKENGPTASGDSDRNDDTSLKIPELSEVLSVIND